MRAIVTAVIGDRVAHSPRFSRVSPMFRNRERVVKVLGVLLAAALAISLVLPFLGSSGW